MNKYKLMLLITFLLSLFFANEVNAIINEPTLIGKTIYLDAGHPSKVFPK